DIGWKYATKVNGERSIECKFCRHRSNGGITRLKEHLAQTRKGVVPCDKVPVEVSKEIRDNLQTFKTLKSKRNELLREIGEGPAGSRLSQDTDGFSQGGSNSHSKGTGTLDKFVHSEPRQTTLNSAYKKELKKDIDRRVARFVYSAGLSFNVVNDPHWLPMVEGIGEYGKGYKPPSMHELRTRLLKLEVSDINIIYEEHKKIWKTYGCTIDGMAISTIMSDGWTDGKNRALINFLVNSPAGTFFLKSVDVSDFIKNGELIFNYLDDIVNEIGEDNVIQVITDNASNFVKAGKKLMTTRKSLWWTLCAAHCIDLMLESIAKLSIFSDTIEKAKRVVKFIYGHGTILSLMRKHTNGKELLRPAVTRFATAFLTLQSMYKQERPLEIMFVSDEWVNSPQAKKVEGKLIKRIVINDPDFWPHVAFCVKSIMPLVSVLREVDSEERPAMGYIYELMRRAKETIKFNCGGIEKKYMPIWRKIDDRWAPQLHHPLHAAGYYLKPQLRYEDSFCNTLEVKDGLYACMDRMLSSDDRLQADIQLDFYDNAQGEFGSPMAKKSRMLRSPAKWWERFGSKTPELMSFAIWVLSLTCSASGCERNWSTFESIHTKKRNRLEHSRLNALVFVKYNYRLRERSIRRRDKMDPIIVDEIDSDDEWITELEDPVLPNNTTWLVDDELFEGDPIVSMPSGTFDSLLDSDKRVEIDVDNEDQNHSPIIKKKRAGESS
ncbi:hAT dimerisation domain-containing protein, partial [Striga hermonthica]